MQLSSLLGIYHTSDPCDYYVISTEKELGILMKTAHIVQ